MKNKLSALLLMCAVFSYAEEKSEQEILYWYDPMRPDQHFEKPGKSPFMDMDLVPKYKDDTAQMPKSKVTLLRQTHSVKTGIVEVNANGELTLPAGAVLNTGKRHFVLRVEDDGFFSAHPVTVSGENNDPTVILNGVHQNDRVVLTPAFLIDSEANIDLMWARFKQGDSHDSMDH